MANTKSAKKAARKSDRLREHNRLHKAQLKHALKRFRGALSAGQVKEARAMLPEVLSVVDRSVRRNVLKRGAASRYKSRLMTALRKASAPKAA